MALLQPNKDQTVLPYHLFTSTYQWTPQEN